MLDVGQLAGSLAISSRCITRVEASNLIAMIIADNGAPRAERAVVYNCHGLTVDPTGVEVTPIVRFKIETGMG